MARNPSPRGPRVRAPRRRQLGQEARQDELQLSIKVLFFERCDDMFALDKFPRLRSADEWAAAKRGLGVGKARRSAKMQCCGTKAGPPARATRRWSTRKR